MKINLKEFMFRKKKENLEQRLNTLKQDRKAIEEAAKRQAVKETKVTEVITSEEIAVSLDPVAPSDFAYRINIHGSVDAYRRITLSNYRELVNKLGHMDKDEEFLRALCLIDRCEEFNDYEYMVRAFTIVEYVVRHNKTNTEVVTYSRQFCIEMRRYLEELNLL
jgi:hypothetical protein